VFKKGDIVSSGFVSPQARLPEFVVHLYRSFAHGVFNATAFQTYRILISDLSLIKGAELLCQKGDYIFGLYRMNGTGVQFRINRLEFLLLMKYNIGGILSRLRRDDTPVVLLLELPVNGTILLGKFVELFMELLYVQRITEWLRFVPVCYVDKSVVQHLKSDTFPVQFTAQPVVSIKIDLEFERKSRLRREHSYIDQSQHFINKITVVGEGFALIVFQEGFMSYFISP